MAANDSSEGGGVQEGAGGGSGKGRRALGCLLVIMLVFAVTTALMVWAGMRRGRAIALLEKARAAARAGDAASLVEADGAFEQALELLPAQDRPDVLYERAAVKTARGEEAEAVALARQAVRLDPQARPFPEVAARIRGALREVAGERLAAATRTAELAGFHREAAWCAERREWWLLEVGARAGADARIRELARLLAEARPGASGRLTIDAFSRSDGSRARPVYGGRTELSWDEAGTQAPVRVLRADDPAIDGDREQPAREEAYCRDLGVAPLPLLWYTTRHFPDAPNRRARLCTAIGAASAEEIVEMLREAKELHSHGDDEWEMNEGVLRSAPPEVVRALAQRCRAERKASFMGPSSAMGELERAVERVAKERGIAVE